MIHVKRPRRNRELFTSSEFLVAKNQLSRFHGAGGTRKLQKLENEEDALRTIRRLGLPEVQRAFGHKCAYTEVEDNPESPHLQLTWHRPPSNAMSAKGETSPEHYWWLATEWPNWRLASAEVIQLKGTQFPVVGERSRARDSGILLDPYQDLPEWHLRFSVDGGVAEVEDLSISEGTKLAGEARGEFTIRMLGLNRTDLQESRRIAIANALSAFGAHPGWPRDGWRSRAHAGAIRQVVATELTTLATMGRARSRARFDHELAIELAPELAALLMTTDARLRPHDEASAVRDAIAGYVPAHLHDGQRFGQVFEGRRPSAAHLTEQVTHATARRHEPLTITRSDRITGIEIENFRAIRRVQLNLSTEPVYLHPAYGSAEWRRRFEAEESFDETSLSSAAPWTALLGENGSGKSSIIQATALALCGRNDRADDMLRTAGVQWSNLLRRDVPGEPPVESGHVLVRFASGTEIRLEFDAEHGAFTQELQVDLRVRGYGAIRLLESEAARLMPTVDRKAQYSQQRDDPAPAGRDVRLANLFNPTIPVIDAGQWLSDLDEEPFNVAAATLARLLGAGEDDPVPDDRPLVTRGADGVRVGGDPLSHVSDGYRSVIAMACDTMAGLGEDMSNLSEARGLVFIDEIGANLHPRWRMQITQRFRHALPNVQFVVSTHEPLCLRGLFAGEVWSVIRFEPHGVFCEHIDKSPSEHRVDQLLTSEFFGLQTAVDPEVDARYRAFNDLLRKSRDEDLNDFEQRQLEDLRRFFATEHQPRLGSTRRDMLVYEAIDRFLGDEALLAPQNRAERRSAVLADVADIWAGAMRRRGMTEVPR